MREREEEVWRATTTTWHDFTTICGTKRFRNVVPANFNHQVLRPRTFAMRVVQIIHQINQVLRISDNVKRNRVTATVRFDLTVL